jgi:hypothetical protein
MTVLRCTVCNGDVAARSQFEVGSDCPECGEGTLVELDPYDDETRVFTVDDDCPVCEAAGFPGQALEPADSVRAPQDEPEHETARAAARRLRDETVGGGVPVDVEAIAGRLGLAVRRGAFAHDGLLRGQTIEVPDRGRHPERFVIAHEIGHYELRHEGDRLKIEPEANAFASELLIPRVELTRVVRRGGASFRSLSQHFEVSQQAVVYALRSAKLLGLMGR